jgi:hypothetical protein
LVTGGATLKFCTPPDLVRKLFVLLRAGRAPVASDNLALRSGLSTNAVWDDSAPKKHFFIKGLFMCGILADRVKTHDDFRAGIPFSPAAQ